VPAVLPNANND